MAKTQMTLRFQSDGQIRAIHSDDLLNELANLFPNAKIQCPRASHVNFDFRIQRWRVKPKNHPTLKQSFKTRKEAIEFEVQWLNKHVIGK